MISELWNKWFERESSKLKKNNEGRPAKRRYFHFDSKLSDINRKKTHELLEPESVAKHSFYPFIRIDTKKKRFHRVKGAQGKLGRREKTIKRRPIDYASHQDSLVYSWYGFILLDLYEQELKKRGISENVIAYRSIKTEKGEGMTNIHFAKDAFDFIHSHAPCFVLALDVTKFFEEIDHSHLKHMWELMLGGKRLPDDHFNVFKNITEYRFVRMGRMISHVQNAQRKKLSRIFSTTQEFKKHIIDKHLQEKGKKGKGIPQGSPISPMLANLYMLEFDTVMADKVREIGGLYRRYSDDILIVFPPEHSQMMENYVRSEIEKLSLFIKETKTERRLCVENEGEVQALDPSSMKASSFQYLGIETDGTNRRIRHGSLARFQGRANRQIRTVIENAVSKKRKVQPKKYLHKKFGEPNGNFLAYTKRASKILNAPNIEHQVSPVRESRRMKEKIEKISKGTKRIK
ncbi:MAG: antiviral reverse transcriptase Drt2 [Candidatus Paceibacterota bacterium]|jgi:hypothetical protein